ncbi:uncharacterized protein PGTG_20562 [Puccinia graminis f. sp. tritici CRL 75-36-700-3]|uniref:Uncharacterized protein n=1 Tax=Puccinia graminis f. sp. tritici (strain CRL 75-36-700-3 / race SCCL) TaxID=418459 RepID=E3NYF7_PUCGT|nr:uncharacterized protein PGTG_20562 [Puccinia graminis f. sp. tritici CRL 75-36-700-3]EFP94606.2 hypothetical protein PGTG_20562 [Puccinia graminis f. sp. tritici CRL 75-36-700-3]
MFRINLEFSQVFFGTKVCWIHLPLYRDRVVELCRNWGTKSDPHFSGYHNGNESKPGYGHIAITSDDVEKTWSLSSRILMAIGSVSVKFQEQSFSQKKPNDNYHLSINHFFQSV